MKKTDEIMNRVPRSKIQGIKHFQPGELITAERLNEIIDAIESLQARVNKLEGHGK